MTTSTTTNDVPDGYEVTFKVDGEPMLICCVAHSADEAIETARENIAQAGYVDDYPVIQVKRY